jgi:hypothetical protein
MGEKRNAYTISVGKPERKTPVRRPRYMRDVDWIHLA